jgi:hypothetical protein
MIGTLANGLSVGWADRFQMPNGRHLQVRCCSEPATRNM